MLIMKSIRCSFYLFFVTLILAPKVSFATTMEALVAEYRRPPENARFRCSPRIYEFEFCESMRMRFLHQGLVSISDVNLMREHALFPVIGIDHDTHAMTVSAVCPCGDFDGSSHVATSDTQQKQSLSCRPTQEIGTDDKIVSLVEDSDIQSLVTDNRRCARLTTHGPEEADLFWIQAGELRAVGLTQNHPVLLYDGTMMKAKFLEVGQSLLSTYGNEIRIKEITKRAPTDEVNYSLLDGDSENAHIVFAEGIAMGDLWGQSSLDEE